VFSVKLMVVLLKQLLNFTGMKLWILCLVLCLSLSNQQLMVSK
jgi:hypothetical protein